MSSVVRLCVFVPLCVWCVTLHILGWCRHPVSLSLPPPTPPQVGYVVWHPCAENVLASVGFDHKIIIWNVDTDEQLCSLDGFHSDIIYSMSWNYDGSLIATTCKDKKIRVLDPRKKELIKVSSCVR